MHGRSGSPIQDNSYVVPSLATSTPRSTRQNSHAKVCAGVDGDQIDVDAKCDADFTSGLEPRDVGTFEAEKSKPGHLQLQCANPGMPAAFPLPA